MRSIQVLSLIPCISLLLSQFTVAQPADMTLVWSDEFEGEGLPDPTKWSYDVGGEGWGNNELQYYTSDTLKNARVEDGLLIIEAHREVFQNQNYTSARLVTKGKGDWLYGRIEVRAKLPRGRGTWPAIWMLSTDWSYGGWPESGEIDIMEHVGYDMDNIHATVHTKSFNHTLGTQVGTTILAPKVDQRFYIYSLEWRPDRVDVFLNDTHYFSFPNDKQGFASWPFDKRFHLLLNIAIGGNWGGLEGVDDSVFPQRMEVDYVRVYAFDDQSSGFVHKIPGNIPAAQFVNNVGLDVEPTQDVGGGLNLGWIESGDQAAYSLDVQSDGVYELNIRYASPLGTTGIRVLVNDEAVLNIQNLQATGDWQSWTNTNIGDVPLKAGKQTLKLEFIGTGQDDLNLNWMSLYSPVDAVHQFFNPQNGAYFFTGFNQEAQAVLQNLPQWQYQGLSFGVEYGPTKSNLPVFRFFNNRSGSHFYTANTDERDNVIATLSHQYSYEGIAFYVQGQAQGPDLISQQVRDFYPIWRFYLQQTSSHFFTGDPAEVTYIQEFVPAEIMRFEGIAWYSDRIYNQ